MIKHMAGYEWEGVVTSLCEDFRSQHNTRLELVKGITFFAERVTCESCKKVLAEVGDPTIERDSIIAGE